MIFLVSRYHAYAFADWLRSPRGRDLADRIRVLYYQDLHRRRRLPAGTWVFADLGRLGPAQLEMAFRAWLEWATMNLPAAYRELLRVPAYLREAYGSGGEGPVRERPGPAILPEGPPDGRAGPGGAGP